MPSSSTGARARFALLALVMCPLWACATAIDNVQPDSSPLAASGTSGDASEGGGPSASGGSGEGLAGSSASAGKGSATGAAGHGASGAPAQSGGAGSGSAGSAGKGGAASGGTGSAGKGGSTSTGGAGKGGSSSAGTSGGGTSNGGTSAGGTSAGGTTGSATCDAAHAVATLITNQVYTGKANDCVRLAVNPGWSTIALQFQPMPSTAGYPVPFSYFSCGGNGAGSLTADYANTTFKSGPNPGCDFFVQFGGGGTTIKVTYYD